MTDNIIIENKPTEVKLKELGVKNWAIWEKEISEFPWHYEESETCYFLTGKVFVTTYNGETMEMGKGDLVTFPAGMSCTWKITADVKKHYKFG